MGYIDEALTARPRDFDDFLRHLSESGCKIKKRGKTISVMPPSGAKRYFRFRTGKNGLPDGYDEESLREKIAAMWVGVDISLPLDERQPGTEGHATVEQKPLSVMPVFELEPPLNIVLGEKIKSLIDIENSAKAQNSRGYETWAKSFNLQQAAQTLLFLQENNIADIESLGQMVSQMQNEFATITSRINSADMRLKEISTLQKHIGSYRKTRDIYSQYLRSKRSKDFYDKNEKAIQSCEAAKEFFDKLGLEKIPTIKELQAEYASLVGEKQKGILQRDQLRKPLADLQAAHKNVQAILGLSAGEPAIVRDTHETR